MPKQTVPDISFDMFVLKEISHLFRSKTIKINEEYQRGDIWKDKQRIELIRSIVNRYSIGVLVLFVNEHQQFEILDGQQRLLTIKKYVDGTLNLTKTEIPAYGDLSFKEKALLDAYCIFYLKLKSHDPETKEEDIVQTFLRLQEGTPLNKAEKISAHRGKFKDTFRQVRETNPFFQLLGEDKRFRWRQLAAEMLLIELEGDFNRMSLPDIDLPALLAAIKKYEKSIPPSRVKFFNGNLDLLHDGLNIVLTAFTAREAIAFYLLVSYLRKKRANNSKLRDELAEFAREFLMNLNNFSIYDEKPPKGMPKKLFLTYRTYKQESKILTSGESLRRRLEIIVGEFDRLHRIIVKDPTRLHDAEQKRILYFRQKGICPECGKEMNYRQSSSHHIVPHSAGGKTSDLKQAVLLHERCHARLEKKILKHGPNQFEL